MEITIESFCIKDVFYTSSNYIFNKRALMATITVLRDINIAPTAGLVQCQTYKELLQL